MTMQSMWSIRFVEAVARGEVQVNAKLTAFQARSADDEELLLQSSSGMSDAARLRELRT